MDQRKDAKDLPSHVKHKEYNQLNTRDAGKSSKPANNLNLPLKATETLRKSNMALAAFQKTELPTNTFNSKPADSILKNANAVNANITNNFPAPGTKRASVILSGAYTAPIVPKDAIAVKTTTDAIDLTVQAAKNAPVAERPAVWGKSTSKKARRESLLPKVFPEESNTHPKDAKKEEKKERLTKRNSIRVNYVGNKAVVHESSKVMPILDDEEYDFKHSASQESLNSINSKTSILLDSLLKNLKSLNRPVRGPILLQFMILYLIFLLILFVSWKTNWAPQIRFYVTFVYFVASCLSIQLARLGYAFNVHSVLPIYISLINFFIIIFISREAHSTVFVLWFVSTGLIFLQSGHPNLKLHISIYFLLLISFYIILMGIMSQFYKPDCHTIWCGVQLGIPISAPKESVILADCLIVMAAFLTLESFIQLNALTLVERDNYMNQLLEANKELRKKLNGDDDIVDLEAPLTKATQILQQIKDDQELDRMVKDEIDFIVGILSADPDKLYKPNIYQKPADADVHDWLNDLLLADKLDRPGSHTSNGQVLPLHSTSTNPNSEIPLADSILYNSDKKVFEFLDKRIFDPEFDVFELSNLANGRCVYYIGWYLFRKYKFTDLLGMDEVKFKRWLNVIESGYYANNPYHNALHAADVTHSMHYYVSRPRIWSLLKAEEMISAIIAPLIHDYSHPGFNNAFLISTKNALAIRYNDIAVLEQFHVASVFELMSQEEYNIFSSFNTDSKKLSREMIISMVHATDMAAHFDWIGKFKNKMTGSGLNLENKQDRKLLLNMAMKSADLNNPSKKLKYCRKWTDMIMREFFNQGDEEKKRGLKVSMFMDRDTTDIPKCQVGFIDFIVQPLFESWSSFMKEDVDIHLKNIANNKLFWKSCIENPQLYHSKNDSEEEEAAHILDTSDVIMEANQLSFAVGEKQEIPELNLNANQPVSENVQVSMIESMIQENQEQPIIETKDNALTLSLEISPEDTITIPNQMMQTQDQPIDLNNINTDIVNDAKEPPIEGGQVQETLGKVPIEQPIKDQDTISDHINQVQDIQFSVNESQGSNQVERELQIESSLANSSVGNMIVPGIESNYDSPNASDRVLP